MSLAQRILLFGIQAYRWGLSPFKQAVFGPTAGCRFSPTCSAYGYEAIRRYGTLQGSWLLCRRICRCHPWGHAGWDPVPDRSPVRTRQNPSQTRDPDPAHPHPSNPIPGAIRVDPTLSTP
jgi:hypothetical protein